MARIQLPRFEEMTPLQRSVQQEAASGRRGHAPAPMIAWLHDPELARRAQRLGEWLRYDTALPPRLSELAILVVARHWNCHYEWHVHEREARAAGVSAGVMRSIVSRDPPELETDAERAVYRITASLMETRGVPEPLYREGIAALTERGLVDLVGIVGYYTFVAMTLNTFEIGLPEHLQSDLGEPPTSFDPRPAG